MSTTAYEKAAIIARKEMEYVRDRVYGSKEGTSSQSVSSRNFSSPQQPCPDKRSR